MIFSLSRCGALLWLLVVAMGCLPPLDEGPPAAADLGVTESDLSTGAAPPGASAAYFNPDVQRDLDTLGCTASACHGGSASPVITAMPSSSAEWLSNYHDIHIDCTTLDCLGGGANSLLLTKPLAGSATHSGTKPFVSTADPIYQRWLAWIDAGAPYSASGVPATPDMATPPSAADGGTKPSTELLTVTFTTSQSPSAAASPFDPKNVVVVWIEGSNGAFVKTAARWAATRRTKLVSWVAKAGTADVDAVSGATNANYGTLTAKWDMSARQTPAPPLPLPADGTYTIRLELADSNATQPAQNNQGTFTFNRNGMPSSQTGLSNGGFTNVSIVYTGR